MSEVKSDSDINKSALDYIHKMNEELNKIQDIPLTKAEVAQLIARADYLGNKDRGVILMPIIKLNLIKEPSEFVQTDSFNIKLVFNTRTNSWEIDDDRVRISDLKEAESVIKFENGSQIDFSNASKEEVKGLDTNLMFPKL